MAVHAPKAQQNSVCLRSAVMCEEEREISANQQLKASKLRLDFSASSTGRKPVMIWVAVTTERSTWWVKR